MASAAGRDYLGTMKTGWVLFGAAIAVAAPLAAGSAAAKSHTKPAAKPEAATSAEPSVDPGPAKSLGNAGAWTAYLAQNRGGKVCYLVAAPERSEPADAKRKTVMAMVTHRTEDSVANVVSFAAGYPLKEDAEVQLAVGAEKFPLFANGDTAWSRTAELDKTIVTAMTKQRQVVVRATPKKGHPITDTYSLAGFAKALTLIDKACDVKR